VCRKLVQVLREVVQRPSNRTPQRRHAVDLHLWSRHCDLGLCSSSATVSILEEGLWLRSCFSGMYVTLSHCVCGIIVTAALCLLRTGLVPPVDLAPTSEGSDAIKSGTQSARRRDRRCGFCSIVLFVLTCPLLYGRRMWLSFLYISNFHRQFLWVFATEDAWQVSST